MNSIESNNLSLKYQRFTSSGCNDIQGLENLSLWGKKTQMNSRNLGVMMYVETMETWWANFKAKIGARKT